MTPQAAINTALPFAVFVIMFALGLGLTIKDFRDVRHRPSPLVIGVAAQMILVPLTGYILVVFYPIDDSLSFGIMVLVLCPGGAISNVLARLAGGDVALSVSLTAITTILSIATLPAMSVVLAEYFVGDGVRHVGIRDILFKIALTATLPVLLGTMLRHFAPDQVERHEAVIFRLSFMVFMIVIGWSVVAGADALKQGIFLLGGQLVVLGLLLFGIGYALGKLFGFSDPQRITLSMETGLQNGGLGLVVGSMLWADASSFSLYAMPSGVYGALTYLLIILVVILKRRTFASG